VALQQLLTARPPSTPPAFCCCRPVRRPHWRIYGRAGLVGDRAFCGHLDWIMRRRGHIARRVVEAGGRQRTRCSYREDTGEAKVA